MNARMSSSGSAVDWRIREGWQRIPSRTKAQLSDPSLLVQSMQLSYLAMAGAITALLGRGMAAWIFTGVGVALLITAGVMTAARSPAWIDLRLVPKPPARRDHGLRLRTRRA